MRRWLRITMVVLTGSLAVPFAASADRELDDHLKRVNIEAEADIGDSRSSSARSSAFPSARSRC